MQTGEQHLYDFGSEKLRSLYAKEIYADTLLPQPVDSGGNVIPSGEIERWIMEAKVIAGYEPVDLCATIITLAANMAMAFDDVDVNHFRRQLFEFAMSHLRNGGTAPISSVVAYVAGYMAAKQN